MQDGGVAVSSGMRSFSKARLQHNRALQWVSRNIEKFNVQAARGTNYVQYLIPACMKPTKLQINTIRL